MYRGVSRVTRNRSVVTSPSTFTYLRLHGHPAQTDDETDPGQGEEQTLEGERVLQKDEEHWEDKHPDTDPCHGDATCESSALLKVRLCDDDGGRESQTKATACNGHIKSSNNDIFLFHMLYSMSNIPHIWQYF